jgi:DNA replication protein DnaC
MESIGPAKQRATQIAEEREAEAQNILNLVQSCIQRNDIEQARELVFQLSASHRAEGMNIVRNAMEKPKETCPDCGEPIEFGYEDYNMCWRKFRCLKCEHQVLMQELKNELHEIMTYQGIPKRYLNASLNDFPEGYRKQFRTDKGLFLEGPRGVGKTHAEAALMKSKILQAGLIEGWIDGAVKEPCWMKPLYQDYPLYISASEFLLKIRATFKNNSEMTENEAIEKYSNAKILYLDDIGAEKPTDWAIATLYLLIDRRYSEMRQTVISSNLSLDELADRFDDRISSRVAGMCSVIKMEGKDRRLK